MPAYLFKFNLNIKCNKKKMSTKKNLLRQLDITSMTNYKQVINI